MNSKDLSLNLLSVFYHVEFESSIASHRATPVFVEIWIIRDLRISAITRSRSLHPQSDNMWMALIKKQTLCLNFMGASITGVPAVSNQADMSKTTATKTAPLMKSTMPPSRKPPCCAKQVIHSWNAGNVSLQRKRRPTPN